MSPAGQQTLLMQLFVAHTLPQDPQFPLSLVVSRQEAGGPGQNVLSCPVQLDTQFPFAHKSGGAQILPQPLAAS